VKILWIVLFVVSGVALTIIADKVDRDGWSLARRRTTFGMEFLLALLCLASIAGVESH
jgi:hypothetical protein